MNKYRTAFTAVCLVIFSAFSQAEGEDMDGFSVMFWNLENFFDWRDSGGSPSDTEFSSYGERHWTRRRFYAKCSAVAKSVMWTGSRYGRMPDIAGFAEVENGFVVKSLIYSTALKKYDYGMVHYDSGDPRGIDVALIYRKGSFRCIGSRAHGIYGKNGERIPTRDILEVELQSVRDSSLEVTVIVNHHPSKYGGEKESLPRREAAMERLRQLADSLLKTGHGNIVAVGDFNDTPDSPAMRIVSGVLHDKSYRLFKSGAGTIRYRGRWELIDLVMVSGNLAERTRMEICRIPILMVDDSSAPGKKPLRTYSGPRYNGGVSDHLPVMAFISWRDENM